MESPQRNRLASEASVYLRQHAQNPVDWYPWGPEAHEKAKALDCPILLSIGYSACHWCHVMEHESFDDVSIATLLNENFVSIKVDREERPDIDQVYMSAVQAMTGQGGWPLTVFLTPERMPFYGGTYFPPEDHHGRPSFRRVLETIIDWWKTKRGDVDQFAGELVQELGRHQQLPRSEGELNVELLSHAGDTLRSVFDREHGGFGSAPKFPHAVEITLLLRLWKRFGASDYLDMATVTLEKMARGGIHDQLGGGFHRYSTDARWLVPHFEKMLYDNALLARAYVHAYQATRKPYFRETAAGIFDYELREMTSPRGPFYSTQDADSEGEEGVYYVWTLAQIIDILGNNLGNLIADVYDVTAEGNWEGRSILNRSKTDEQLARQRGMTISDLRSALASAKGQLLEARMRRIPPGRDEKTLTAWNGLMIKSLAEGALVLGDNRYYEAATRAAAAILDEAEKRGGRLTRTCMADQGTAVDGFLEDYAFLVNGLISLYESAGHQRWLKAAVRLTEMMIAEFHDPSECTFQFSGSSHEQLVVRGQDLADGSVPSGNSMAATGLLRVSALTGRHDFRKLAQSVLRHYQGLMSRSPMAAAQMLHALDFDLGPVDDIVVVGRPGEQEFRDALEIIYRQYWPNRVIAMTQPSDDDTALEMPLLAERRELGAVTTYLCQGGSCQEPIIGTTALGKQLSSHADTQRSPHASPSTSSET